MGYETSDSPCGYAAVMADAQQQQSSIATATESGGSSFLSSFVSSILGAGSGPEPSAAALKDRDSDDSLSSDLPHEPRVSAVDEDASADISSALSSKRRPPTRSATARGDITQVHPLLQQYARGIAALAETVNRAGASEYAYAYDDVNANGGVSGSGRSRADGVMPLAVALLQGIGLEGAVWMPHEYGAAENLSGTIASDEAPERVDIRGDGAQRKMIDAFAPPEDGESWTFEDAWQLPQETHAFNDNERGIPSAKRHQLQRAFGLFVQHYVRENMQSQRSTQNSCMSTSPSEQTDVGSHAIDADCCNHGTVVTASGVGSSKEANAAETLSEELMALWTHRALKQLGLGLIYIAAMHRDAEAHWFLSTRYEEGYAHQDAELLESELQEHPQSQV